MKSTLKYFIFYQQVLQYESTFDSEISQLAKNRLVKVKPYLPLASFIFEHNNIVIDNTKIHVSRPLRTSDACVMARATRQTSCCTERHESVDFRLLAFSIASDTPGKELDP